ncbi:MAG: hypothetical protein LBH90_07080 [Tannerella sp.]|nr:hypothetical protein [Tannerella sp.]
MYCYETSHTYMQPDTELIRCLIGWLYVATDKWLYVPTQVLPDNHTTGRLYNSLGNCPDRQTTG